MPPPNEDSRNLGLDAIQAPDSVPDTPDEDTAREDQALDEEARLELQHAARRRDLELNELEQNIKARKLYAKLIFGLVCGWLVCVLVIAILEGLGASGEAFYFFRRFPIKFKLESNVMIALIATTTANIIAVLVIVMKYLFPNQKS